MLELSFAFESALPWVREPDGVTMGMQDVCIVIAALSSDRDLTVLQAVWSGTRGEGGIPEVRPSSLQH